MEPSGFEYYAHTAPNRLALAAPDGRHWSRGELWAECERLVKAQQADNLELPTPSLPNEAGYIAMALSFQMGAIGAGGADAAASIETALRLMQTNRILPEHHNIHYCIAPASSDSATCWAVASLHIGHAVIIADRWDARQMMRDIEHYRVTTVCLSPTQLAELSLLPARQFESLDTGSVRHLIHSGPPCSIEATHAGHSWWHSAAHEQGQPGGLPAAATARDGYIPGL